MSAGAHPPTQRLIAKLDSTIALSDEERAALLNLPVQVAEIEADQDIVRAGARPTQGLLVLEGIACTYKETAEGKRQIMAFHIAGDLPDLQSLHLDKLDNSVAAITPCRVGFIAHEALLDLCARHPRITAALWRQTLIDAATAREWVLNVGRRRAHSRMAHVFCELVVRHRAVGLAEGHACELPISQIELADALGLSVVHVNRVLQELRSAGLIRWDGTRLAVLDWGGLQLLADFAPDYLHIRDGQAAA